MRPRDELMEARPRGRQVNPAGPIYEVKAGGHTIEWTDDLRAAAAAFQASGRHDRKVYRLIAGVKYQVQIQTGASPSVS